MPTKQSGRGKGRQGERERTSGSERNLKGSAPGAITGNLKVVAMKTKKNEQPENPENIIRQLTQKVKEMALIPEQCTVFMIGELLNLEEQLKNLKSKMLEM